MQFPSGTYMRMYTDTDSDYPPEPDGYRVVFEGPCTFSIVQREFWLPPRPRPWWRGVVEAFTRRRLRDA